MDVLRGVERELEGDTATEGVSDEMGPLHTEVSQQRPAVGGVLRDADRVKGAAAADVAATVVGDDPVANGQTGFGQQRLARVGSVSSGWNASAMNAS